MIKNGALSVFMTTPGITVSAIKAPPAKLKMSPLTDRKPLNTHHKKPPPIHKAQKTGQNERIFCNVKPEEASPVTWKNFQIKPAKIKIKAVKKRCTPTRCTDFLIFLCISNLAKTTQM